MTILKAIAITIAVVFLLWAYTEIVRREQDLMEDNEEPDNGAQSEKNEASMDDSAHEDYLITAMYMEERSHRGHDHFP
ncbi:hypothetical protein [Azonexus hydrophilus]|uniref:Uncharacterized protein n=1 Tax=Azonexus hydrophilus TaxID=418702 RepID=A0ABZ2XQ72_9RHOO